jgi:hypothetical protein
LHEELAWDIMRLARRFREVQSTRRRLAHMLTISLHINLSNVQIEGAEGQDVPFAAHDS